VYMRIHVCISIETGAYVPIYVYLKKEVCMYVCMYVCIYVCMDIFVAEITEE